MKADRGIILSSKELHALKKNNSNCSLILISLKCGTSVKNYLSNSFFPACILLCNKNKALYRFLYIFAKFVEMIILTAFQRLLKAVRVSKISFKIKNDIIKNLVCVNRILDLKQNQFLKISKIININKKFGYSFYNKKQSLFYLLAFLLKNIKNKCSRNLYFAKSSASFFDVIIFVTAEGCIFFKNIVMGRSSK